MTTTRRNAIWASTRRAAAGQVSFYAVIHNAATFLRAIWELELYVLPEIQGRLGEAYIEVIGGERFSLESGGTIRLPEMQPGENRWIGLTYESPRGEEGELLPVMFHELVDGRPVNGFAMAVGLLHWTGSSERISSFMRRASCAWRLRSRSTPRWRKARQHLNCLQPKRSPTRRTASI